MYIVISGNLVAAHWEIAAHSVYDKFSWYKFRLSFFPPLGLWSRNFFLTVPFLGHCLLVLFIADRAMFFVHVLMKLHDADIYNKFCLVVPIGHCF